MSGLKTSSLITLLIATTACGLQVVEFRLDDARTADDVVANRPAVTSTMPDSDGMNVSLASTVTATFNKPMNPDTLTMTTFILQQGGTTLSGAVMMNSGGTTATLTPAVPLQPGTTYTATVTTGAMDTGGLTMAADHVWMFTAAPDALPLAVISTTPAPGAPGVAISVSPTATFNKAMNGATVNMTTFTLAQGANPIAGTVMLNGATNTATFNPNIDLTPGLVYTATITTGAMDTGGLTLATNHTWMFTTAMVVLPPMVVSTTPAPGAMNVALNVSPTALFDQPMNPATINMTTFTLSQGATPIAGAVMLDLTGTTATFNPLFDLTPGLVYTATISTGAQATTGMALATQHTWMFTAAAAPSVVSTTPMPNAMNVAVGVSPTALFDRPMNPATINMATFTLAQGATPIDGVVMLDLAGTTATFNPLVELTPGLVYTATITPGAQSTFGVGLASAYSWSFTVETPGPRVTSTTPMPNAINVPINANVTATFDQPMNGATINMSTFTLEQGLTSIGGSVTYDILTMTATLDPTTDLTPGLVYRATITLGAQNTNGETLFTPHTWTFTVGTACIVAPVVLGTAGAFGVLAGSTVTNTGPSVVVGDLGVWPLTSVTGFPPGILTGTLYAGVTEAMTAQGDLTIAYNNLAGRTQCASSLIGDIGGMTLVPGLYKSTGFMSLASGNLVLDAQGDPDARWIFTMVSSLDIPSNRTITIIGGGSAANVYWQVGSSAVIGTSAVVKGTIMADQSISFATNSVLDGRALARIGAVTLDTTVLTRP